jgi:uncharacterized protein (DUF305 family)
VSHDKILGLLRLLRRTASLLLIGCLAVSCRTTSGGAAPIVQPGAPGEASRVVGAEAAVAAQAELPRFTPADVKFMQGMIGHHAQALEMTALLPSRTANPDMVLLAKRIDVSQNDEIKMMQTWLKDRGQELPGAHAHHLPGGLMPGMLTPAEMSRLAAAKGKEFDRLFLEGMIRHHDGALTMVKELFAQPGAGQESDIFAFASDVDADQRMEIVRMSALLKELQK